MTDTTELEGLIDIVKSMGACDKADQMTGWKKVSELMKSPQGIEFMAKHGYPDIETCRKYADKVRLYSIYIDAGKINLRSRLLIGIFIGNTDAEVNCHGTYATHTYVVMHGARITIDARDYSVARVYNIGGEVNIINDGTSKILTR